MPGHLRTDRPWRRLVLRRHPAAGGQARPPSAAAVEQGLQLYRTGHLDVRVTDPDAYYEFGEAVVADPDHARPYLVRIEEAFDAAVSPLPEAPDEAPVEAWLRRVRRALYDTGEVRP
jgi:hypothetical protein